MNVDQITIDTQAEDVENLVVKLILTRTEVAKKEAAEAILQLNPVEQFRLFQLIMMRVSDGKVMKFFGTLAEVKRAQEVQ